MADAERSRVVEAPGGLAPGLGAWALRAGVAPDRALVLGLLAILLFVAPRLLLGEQAVVLVHDNLDSNVIWYELLARHGAWFAPSSQPIAQLAGLPRASFPGELNLLALLFAWLPASQALLANELLQRIAALLGMRLLLGEAVPAGPGRALGVAAGSLGFALLPFWPGAALSVPLVPALAWAFWTATRGRVDWRHWLIAVASPFCGSLVFANLFVGAVAAVTIGAAWLHRRVAPRDALLLFAVFCALSVLAEYRLFQQLLAPSFETHRAAYLAESVGLAQALRAAGRELVHGQYHAAPGHLGAAVAIAVACGLAFARRELRVVWGLVAAFAGIALFYGLWDWRPLAALRHRTGLLTVLNLTRFTVLQPALAWLAAGLSIAACLRLHRTLGVALAGVALAGVVAQDPLLWQVPGRTPFGEVQRFDRFFAERQFAAVRRTLERAGEHGRVASVGLHPAVALHNGLPTVDGYLPNYPLDYKRRFREAIAPELARDPGLAAYFDGWGSRFYVFSSEIAARWPRRQFAVPKGDPAPVHLALDPDAFRALGGTHLLSAVPLVGPHLRLLAVHEDPDSLWTIHVYAVAASREAPGAGRAAAPGRARHGHDGVSS